MPSSACVRRLLVLAFLVGLRPLGPLGGRALAEERCRPLNMVYVANGAGDFRCTSKALQEAVACTGIPLHIEAVLWSHGRYKILKDVTDHANADLQGQLLAEEVLDQRRAVPGGRVYFVGHCAGCAVVLRAAELLPPGAVDRIILLAPSTHACYDLRPALRCPREGLDVFLSHKDWACLGLAVRVCHCLDGRCFPAAGRIGFACCTGGEEETALYAKLRQYPWHPDLKWTGHTGGHYGCYQQSFLRHFILPMMPVAAPGLPSAGHEALEPD